MNFTDLTTEIGNEAGAVVLSANHFCPRCGYNSGVTHSPACDVLNSALAIQSPAYVQSTFFYGGAASNTSGQILLSNQSSGNTNVIGVYFGDATSTVSISDSANNVYTKIVGPVSQSTNSCVLFYSPGISAISTNAITVNFSASTTFIQILGIEYSGIAPTHTIDVSGSATATTGTAISVNITTTNANDLIVAFAVSIAAVLGAAGQTQRVTDGSAGAGGGMEDTIVTTTGSKTMSWTAGGSGIWIILAAAFRSGRLSQRFPSSILHD